MGVGDWIRRVFGGGVSDNESAEVEEYGLEDRGQEALRTDPAPSFFGGVEPPQEDGLSAPPDLAP